jgi:hypothetical protein
VGGESTPVAGSIIFTVTLLRATPAQPKRRLPQWSEAEETGRQGSEEESQGRGGGGGRLTSSDHRGGLSQAVALQDRDADVFEELDHFQRSGSTPRADVLQSPAQRLSDLREDNLMAGRGGGKGQEESGEASRALSANLYLNSSQDDTGRPYSAR